MGREPLGSQDQPGRHEPLVGQLMDKRIKPGGLTHREFMNALGDLMDFAGMTSYFVVAARDTEQPCKCGAPGCQMVDVKRELRTGHSETEYHDLAMLVSHGLELTVAQWDDMVKLYKDEDDAGT